GWHASSYNIPAFLTGSASTETVSWIIPIYENHVSSGDWSTITGSQQVTFTLHVRPDENQEFTIPLDTPQSLNMDNKDDIQAGNIGTANLTTITLSGTISYSGTPPARAWISVQQVYGSHLGMTEIDSPVNNGAWSLIVAALDSQETVGFRVEGLDSSGQQVFQKHNLTPTTVYNTDVGGINLTVTNP
ncbi:MAG: hypothetical protein LBH73_03755, partial [Spirochaetaceae bacterium]|nr:hypothetical protein [Spirochaetaceae bacterium]